MNSTDTPPARTAMHAVDSETALREASSRREGLLSPEVELRIDLYGANRLR